MQIPKWFYSYWSRALTGRDCCNHVWTLLWE